MADVEVRLSVLVDGREVPAFTFHKRLEGTSFQAFEYQQALDPAAQALPLQKLSVLKAFAVTVDQDDGVFKFDNAVGIPLKKGGVIFFIDAAVDTADLASILYTAGANVTLTGFGAGT